jgi:hypothetical protein
MDFHSIPKHTRILKERETPLIDERDDGVYSVFAEEILKML